MLLNPSFQGLPALRSRKVALGRLLAASALFAALVAVQAPDAAASGAQPSSKSRASTSSNAEARTKVGQKKAAVRPSARQASRAGTEGRKAPAAIAQRTAFQRSSSSERNPGRVAAAAAAVGAGGTASAAAHSPGAMPMRGADRAEARLIEVYGLWGRGQSTQALAKARELVRDHPNFQAAQLMYADLLSVRLAPAERRRAQQELFSAPDARATLGELRSEQQLRLQALQHRPPAGTIPSQLLAVPKASRYALAIDVSRSRLYVLRNTEQGLVQEQDFYVSIGKSGAGKEVEGDARTPLGVYHITSNLSPRGLRDFYGAGALPINYPNPFDQRLGRTGSGIWLHGVPPDQYARAPLATDGCVVLADNDLRQLIRITDIGATVVVIARQLDWVPSAKAQAQVQPLREQVLAWRDARARGDLARWESFYMPDAVRSGRLARQRPSLRDEMAQVQGKAPVELKDLSVLRWKDQQELMVVSFGEVAQGARTGATRRQYWLLAGKAWKIFHEEWL
ncbi:L,D-transpeptidase family protein [Xenophilus arseniciresistens]|uniref:L,D-transpeptidase family protein n=1 Tax=Xenophilus arseniciresistens TaxID=1283306 RepID=A0AAE3N9J8_9BURK|nr:L,D-transpeptidase family protein [Xenophilus arseniciresistens]MDA7418180.1 L,D-transpeptidase family protein [Xenophilus arseniciresistens]